MGQVGSVGSDRVLLPACQFLLAGYQKSQNNLGGPVGWFHTVGMTPMLFHERASSASKMRAVANPYPHILCMFLVVKTLLADYPAD